MNKKAWIIFASVCIVLIAGLVYLSGKNKVDVDGVDTSEIQPASEQSGGIADHVFGNRDSKVVLVEYGDFQCPGCGAAHPIVKPLSEKYQDQMAFVFRNFPLPSLHPNAKAAAAAAEAAGLQGKYWEMHNKLYENQSAWEGLASDVRTDFFASYARELGLDDTQFKQDMSSAAVRKKLDYDRALANKVNVTQTPTFFLNGENINDDVFNDRGQINKQLFEARLKQAFEKNGIALPEEK